MGAVLPIKIFVSLSIHFLEFCTALSHREALSVRAGDLIFYAAVKGLVHLFAMH